MSLGVYHFYRSALRRLSPYSLVPMARKHMLGIRGYRAIQEKLKKILAITELDSYACPN